MTRDDILKGIALVDQQKATLNELKGKYNTMIKEIENNYHFVMDELHKMNKIQVLLEEAWDESVRTNSE